MFYFFIKSYQIPLLSNFSVYKKKNYDKEGTDVSDLSLESKQKRGPKKVKPMTKIHWKHAKEIRGNRR